MRRIYFPGLRLVGAQGSPAPSLRPAVADGLIAFDLPAGEHRLVLSEGWTPLEIAGAALSASAAVACLIILALAHGGLPAQPSELLQPRG